MSLCYIFGVGRKVSKMIIMDLKMRTDDGKMCEVEVHDGDLSEQYGSI